MYQSLMTLYTPIFDGKHDVLNGRIFEMRKHNSKHEMAFIDPYKEEIICTSSMIDKVTLLPDGTDEIITESGTRFHLVHVDYLLPTFRDQVDDIIEYYDKTEEDVGSC